MQPLTPSVTDTYSRIVYSNFTAWANPGVNANKHLCYIVMSCSATSVASSTNTKTPVYLSLGYFHVCTYIYIWLQISNVTSTHIRIDVSFMLPDLLCAINIY